MLIDVELRIVKVVWHKGLAYQLSIRDVTERKRIEDALRESNELHKSLLQTIPFGIDIVDEQGNIIFLSENLQKHVGNEAIGKKCWTLYRDDKLQCADCPLKAGIKLGNTDVYETHGVLGGKIFEVIHTGMIFKGKKAILEVFLDITERKQSETELIIAKNKAEESDRLKTAFLHNISHEIRTPMNAIVGFARFINNPNLLPEKRKNFTDIIIQSSNQLLSIINDIVSIASIEAGQETTQETEININLICKLIIEQYSWKLINPNITLRLKTILPDDEAIIISDATKLTQILSNLISNAFKFTQQGFVNFGYTLKDNLLEFYVEDSGIGIPLNMQDEIFKRFRQVKTTDELNYGGSGLGLSISKAYVEMLGGKIWLTSEEDKGSVFYFTLPYKKVNSKDISEKLPSYDLNLEFIKSKTFLIVEDEDSNFMVLDELFSDMKINIIRATNGIEAVEKCKSNPRIDLILMDIKMPKMDGFEATKQIKEFRPNLSIIAQTAYTSEEDKNKIFACGCADFISKPLNTEILLKKINDQLLK